MTDNDKVLMEALLNGHVAKRTPSHSWTWESRWPEAPSLDNRVLRHLFSGGVLTEGNGLMLLTQEGAIAALTERMRNKELKSV